MGIATTTTPKFTPVITEEEARQQARLLKALADPTRLTILSLLSRYEEQASVGELTECLAMEQPTLSHHLRILRDNGLIDYRKKGLWAYYYILPGAIQKAIDALERLRQDEGEKVVSQKRK